MKDPWYKTTFNWSDASGLSLKLQVPHDVFSTQRIDEGTLLFLDHLPASLPNKILDMGCGYGALGLPIAARYPDAQIEMVDRDLLAVEWSAKNALLNGLKNVHAFGSLGFRNVSEQKYDWILCNVPARIGRPFIQNFIESGQTRLHANGELRVVVINDLATTLKEMKEEFGWSLQEIIRGPKHSIFSIAAFESEKIISEPEGLYFRDEVTLNQMKLDRPFDLGGDDPKRLMSGLPLLLDAMPRQNPEKIRSIFCFRSGYGQIPLFARKRWPNAKVVAVDRDLLATAFTRSNAEKLGLDGALLEIRESATFSEAFLENEKFDLILGELSPSAGEWVANSELESVVAHLSEEGHALLLCLDKIEREWTKPFAIKKRIALQSLIKRDGYTAVRIARG